VGSVHTINYICPCKLQEPNNYELYKEIRTTNCLHSCDCVKLQSVYICFNIPRPVDSRNTEGKSLRLRVCVVHPLGTGGTIL